MQNFLSIHYPKCTTCQKAKKWLDDHGVPYEARHIVEQNPTEKELWEWIDQSGLPVKKFFNTSGILYQEMNLKDKLPNLTQEQQIHLLSTNGMLVKRPLLIGADLVKVGFKPSEWEKII